MNQHKLTILSWSFVLMICTLCCPPHYSQAEVLLFDGFGDADLNNNGTPLEDSDVDMTLTQAGSYESPEFEGVPISILTTVEDASDTGLRWLSSRGFTSGAPFHPKANIKIMDDSQGVFPETDFLPALDSGYAMAWDSKGRGSSATAFFDQVVQLGPEEGDQVKVGFDFRTWQSSPNANDFTPPENGTLRFGLYQDTDGQLGTSNAFAGKPNPLSGIPGPAIWGQEEGHFRGDSIGEGPGAIGDHGWFLSIDLGDPTSNFGPLPNGADARIRVEPNTPLGEGDTSSIKFMEGPDGETFASPDSDDPDFATLDSTLPYRLEFTLERTTEDALGDAVIATFDVTNLVTEETWSMSNQRLFETWEFPVTDSWDYFAMRNTGADDFDLLIDNFSVEIFGSNESMGNVLDFNGDSLVDVSDVDELVVAIASGDTDEIYDVNGDGSVDRSDLDQWLSDGGTLNGFADGYLGGDANLDGTVNAVDLNALGGNWQGTPNGWSGGDFDADGAAIATDLNILGNNWLRSSNAAAAPVPEPSTGLMGIICGLGLLLVRRRS